MRRRRPDRRHEPRARLEQFDTRRVSTARHVFVSGLSGRPSPARGGPSSPRTGTTLVELEAGAKLTVPTDRAFAAGAAVMLSARPEQLRLHAEAAAVAGACTGASPCAGAQHHARLETRDGRHAEAGRAQAGAVGEPTGDAWCGLRPDARPGLFDIATST